MTHYLARALLNNVRKKWKSMGALRLASKSKQKQSVHLQLRVNHKDIFEEVNRENDD